MIIGKLVLRIGYFGRGASEYITKQCDKLYTLKIEKKQPLK